MLLPFMDNFFAFFGGGMVISMLEPHLEAAGASVTQTGTAFLVEGLVFMVATGLAGLVSFFETFRQFFAYLKCVPSNR